VHGLPPEYAEWVSAAAMLYEVGDFVNRNGRHRHAYYIISHSEILGYTPEQRRIIAAIARYLGKSRPTPGDSYIKALPTADQEYVAKASLLLRLHRIGVVADDLVGVGHPVPAARLVDNRSRPGCGRLTARTVRVGPNAREIRNRCRRSQRRIGLRSREAHRLPQHGRCRRGHETYK
jgi:hypothetical protein